MHCCIKDSLVQLQYKGAQSLLIYEPRFPPFHPYPNTATLSTLLLFQPPFLYKHASNGSCTVFAGCLFVYLFFYPPVPPQNVLIPGLDPSSTEPLYTWFLNSGLLSFMSMTKMYRSMGFSTWFPFMSTAWARNWNTQVVFTLFSYESTLMIESQMCANVCKFTGLSC